MRQGPIEQQLYPHLITLLAVSAGMVGVCLTAISLIGIFQSHSKLDTALDEILSVDALLFLAATLIVFLGLRAPLKKRSAAIALAADSMAARRARGSNVFMGSPPKSARVAFRAHFSLAVTNSAKQGNDM